MMMCEWKATVDLFVVNVKGQTRSLRAFFLPGKRPSRGCLIHNAYPTRGKLLVARAESQQVSWRTATGLKPVEGIYSFTLCYASYA